MATQRSAFIKSGSLLAASNVAVGVFGFVRNIIIASQIGPENFGIASVFLLTVSFVDMTSNLSMDRLLVQDPEGDTPLMQSSNQRLLAYQGIAGTILLIALAWPATTIFSLQGLEWAFLLLAFIPALKGFSHLDRARLQRNMNFKAQASVDLSSQIIATLIAWPACWYFGDYRAMLVTLICQFSVFFLATHLVAERRWSLALKQEYLARGFQFGWPLLVNGLLMFGVLQADKAIVGRWFNMTDLGWFSAGAALTMVPVTMFVSTVNSLILPGLSKLQNEPERHRESARTFTIITLVISISIVAGYATSGPAILVAVYGHEYAPGTALIGLMGMAQAARLIRVGPDLAALSLGDTKNPLLTNCIRVIAVPAAIIWVSVSGEIKQVVITAILAELLASLASFFLLKRRLGVDILPSFFLICTALVCFYIAFDFGWLAFDISLALALPLAIASGTVPLLTAYFLMPTVRIFVRKNLLNRYGAGS